MLKFGKNNDPILRKQLDRQKDGTMNRPYFIGLLWLPPGVQEVQLQKIGILSDQLKIIASQSACKKSAHFINLFLRYSRF